VYKELITSKGDRLGDVGCNDGYFGVLASQHDFNVTFIDRSDAYLNVVREKMSVLNTKHTIINADLDDAVTLVAFKFDVTLYLDVFYHVVLERNYKEAIRQLDHILARTREKVIFAPGRWDKLAAHGCTQASLFEIIRSRYPNCKIKYLGRDNDKGYRRDIYCIDK
jgi:cyclopropane fatty-acyl-phospholipid synthase-like methyltransferase